MSGQDAVTVNKHTEPGGWTGLYAEVPGDALSIPRKFPVTVPKNR